MYYVLEFNSLQYIEQRWFSGRMLTCHVSGPGSIPGYYIFFKGNILVSSFSVILQINQQHQTQAEKFHNVVPESDFYRRSIILNKISFNIVSTNYIGYFTEGTQDPFWSKNLPVFWFKYNKYRGWH